DGDVKSGGAGDLDIVGGGAGMVAVGGKDRVEVKSLRRLRAPEPGALGDAGDASLRAGPQGIGDGKGGRGGLGMVERACDAGDDGRRDERAGAVMDQDAGDAAAGERGERV